MADIEIALFSYLQTKTGLTALVGARIYKNRLPEKGTRPCVLYERLAANRDRVLSGSLGACAAVYQFDVFADSAASLEAVRQQLRVALDGYSGTSGSVTIQSSWLINDWDEYVPDIQQYRACLEFEVTFLE